MMVIGVSNTAFAPGMFLAEIIISYEVEFTVIIKFKNK